MCVQGLFENMGVWAEGGGEAAVVGMDVRRATLFTSEKTCETPASTDLSRRRYESSDHAAAGSGGQARCGPVCFLFTARLVPLSTTKHKQRANCQKKNARKKDDVEFYLTRLFFWFLHFWSTSFGATCQTDVIVTSLSTASYYD